MIKKLEQQMVYKQATSENQFFYDQDQPYSLIMLGDSDKIIELLLLDTGQFIFAWLQTNNSKIIQKQISKIENSLSLKILKYSDFGLLKIHISQKRLAQHILVVCSPQMKDHIQGLNKFKCIICYPSQEYYYCQNYSYSLYQVQTLQELSNILDKYRNTIKIGYKWLPNFLILDTEAEASNTLVRTLWAMINYQKNSISQDLVIKKLRRLIQNLGRCNFSLKVGQQTLKTFIQQLNQGQMPCQRSIYWYTLQSQIFKIVNNLLRSTQQPSLIFYIQPYFASLFKSISTLYKQQKYRRQFICYRGGKITEKQIQKFSQSIGSLIQNLGFLSTSLDKQVSKIYMKNVLFQIMVDEEKSQPLNLGYANISQYSQFYSQSQILFNPLNFFKILSIQEIIKQQRSIFIIQLLFFSAKKIKQSKETNENYQLNAILAARQMEWKDKIKCQGDSLIVQDHPKKGGLLYWEKLSQIAKAGAKKFEKAIYQQNTCGALDPQKLKKMQKLFRKFKQAYFQSLKHIGICLEHKGDYKSAKEKYEQYEQQIKKFSGARIQLGYIQILDKIANIEYLKGNFNNSLQIYVKAQQNLVQNFGQNNLQHAQILYRQANIYKQKYQLDKAISLHQKSIKIRQKSQFMSIHYNLAAIANIYKLKQNFSKALQFHSKALKYKIKLNGFHHPQVSDSLDNMGFIYQIKGQFKKSSQVIGISLSIKQVCLGIDHPGIATSLFSIGYNYFQQFLYEEALQYYEKSQKILIKSGQQKTPANLYVFGLMASIYTQKNENAKALKLLKAAQKIAFQLYGETHLKYISIVVNMASIYVKQKQYKIANQLYQKAEKELLASVEDSQLLYSIILNNRANILRVQQKYHQALLLYQKALESKKCIYKSGHYSFSIILNNIANIYLQLLNFSKAFEFYFESRIVILKFLGHSHPEYGTMLTYISLVYQLKGDLKNALSLQRISANIKRNIFRKFDFQHLNSLIRTARLYKMSGEFEKSLKVYKYVLKNLSGTNKLGQIQCYKDILSLYEKTGNRREYQKFLLQYRFLFVQKNGKRNELQTIISLNLHKAQIFLDIL